PPAPSPQGAQAPDPRRGVRGALAGRVQGRGPAGVGDAVLGHLHPRPVRHSRREDAMSASCVPLPGLARRLAARAEDFFGRPASPRPLAVLRIGLALVLLVQALAIGRSLPELYGEQGIVRWPITHALAPQGVPRVGWLASALAPLGVSADACLRGVFLLYLAGLGGLLVGWRTRPSALVAWLAHLALNTSGAASIYGVDALANIGLFYCVWMPVGHALSADVLAGRASGAP